MFCSAVFKSLKFLPKIEKINMGGIKYFYPECKLMSNCHSEILENLSYARQLKLLSFFGISHR